jgi:hypothetical protein
MTGWQEHDVVGTQLVFAPVVHHHVKAALEHERDVRQFAALCAGVLL